jgi:UDP-N-acetylmuramate: L-alanyl-gamma-D-glutamyl-meso-diaminopimelate ligase
MIGAHNAENALAALAAARHAGVSIEQGIQALRDFQGVARRMQLRGVVAGVHVYDDFAHHPSAIVTTIDGLRRRVGRERIIGVLELRSQTMRRGVHQATLAGALGGADEVWLYAPPRAHVTSDLEGLARELALTLQPGDHALIMSNGGFGGLHSRLLEALAARAP